jgi:hypothetical protein
MEFLNTLAYCLGWADIVAATVLLVGAGLPARPGHAPRGMTRCLFYKHGFVVCRYDLQPMLCERLRRMGYRFVKIGQGRWRIGLALPGRLRGVGLVEQEARHG